MTNFTSLSAKAQSHLEGLSKAVYGIVPNEIKNWKIKTRGLAENGNELGIINEVKKWSEKGCLYLYTITICSGIIDPSDLVEAYNDKRTLEKGKRAYARLNNPSMCMYVGSSEKVYQRLKEHLGFGAQGTYSLQLTCWANSFDLEIEFECAKYSATIGRKVLQVLEDTLWAELLPMFGRQGAR